MRFKLELKSVQNGKSIARALTLVGSALLATTAHAQMMTGVAAAGMSPSTGVAMPSIAQSVSVTLAMSGHAPPPNRAPALMAPSMPIVQPMAPAPAQAPTAMMNMSYESRNAQGFALQQQMVASVGNQQAQLGGAIGINSGYANQLNQISVNAAAAQTAISNNFATASLAEVIASSQAQSTARAAGIRAGVAAGGSALSNGTGFVPFGGFGGMGMSNLSAGAGLFGAGSYQSLAYNSFSNMNVGGFNTLGGFGGPISKAPQMSFGNFGAGLNSVSPTAMYGVGSVSPFSVSTAPAAPTFAAVNTASNPWAVQSAQPLAGESRGVQGISGSSGNFAGGNSVGGLQGPRAGKDIGGLIRADGTQDGIFANNQELHTTIQNNINAGAYDNSKSPIRLERATGF